MTPKKKENLTRKQISVEISSEEGISWSVVFSEGLCRKLLEVMSTLQTKVSENLKQFDNSIILVSGIY